jgi:hypothetical protein
MTTRPSGFCRIGPDLAGVDGFDDALVILGVEPVIVVHRDDVRA